MTKRVLSAILLAVILLGGVFAGCNSSDDSNAFDFSPGNVVAPSDASPSAASSDATNHGYSVSSSSDLACDVAKEVLEDGGNAADAAIALSYTLSVVEHYASGLGGSGGLLIYDPKTKRCEFYDYRACSGSDGYSVIGVPGFVKGMEKLHEDYGTVSMEKLLEPAAEYAENGFTINDALEYRIHAASSTLSSNSAFCDSNGNLLGKGKTLVQSELGKTIRMIQQGGSDAFYKGQIAEDIALATPLTTEDLAAYTVNKTSAVVGSYRGYTVYGSPAPLSGVVLIQMLEMSEKLDIPDPRTNPNEYLTDLSRITQLAYSDRYYTITDPSFYDEGTDVGAYMQSLVSDDYVEKLLGIGTTEAADLDVEKPETTSFSIVDSSGMVVCATNTLSSFWGSQLSVDGFFVNNTNLNFSSDGVNRYQSEKRSRTFTAPTIITGDDGYILAVGTPGGNNIPSVLFNVIVDLLKFDEDPQEAVTKSRFLYRGGVLTVEGDKDGSTWIDLSGLNENIIWHDTGYWWGSVSLAGYSDSDGAFSAYDYRRGATHSIAYNPEPEKE